MMINKKLFIITISLFFSVIALFVSIFIELIYPNYFTSLLIIFFYLCCGMWCVIGIILCKSDKIKSYVNEK